MTLADRLAALRRTATVDLLAESAERTELARGASRAVGPGRNVNDPSERDTACWPDAHGPDLVVFGSPKPPLMGREVLGGPRMRTCRACQVQWAGDGPCWCCGQ